MAAPTNVLRVSVLGLFLFSSLALFLWGGLTLKHQAQLQLRSQSKSLARQSEVQLQQNIGVSTSKAANCSRTKKIKLLCWIMTIDSEEGHKKSKAGLETWGRRCDKVLLVRNGTNLMEKGGVFTIPLKEESRAHLWHKVKEAFSYLYKNHLDEYDWFMKADDDTYVLVDRLRQFLTKHSNDEPVYFGYKFKPFVNQGYMSGGSGYVVSKQALKLLVEGGFQQELEGCDLTDAEEEDIRIGQCFEALGVAAGDTRDALGKPTFLAISPVDLINERKINKDFWYNQYAFYEPPKAGKECCSNEPISFHYIEPRIMYFIDWLLYDVKKVMPSQLDHGCDNQVSYAMR